MGKRWGGAVHYARDVYLHQWKLRQELSNRANFYLPQPLSEEESTISVSPCIILKSLALILLLFKSLVFITNETKALLNIFTFQFIWRSFVGWWLIFIVDTARPKWRLRKKNTQKKTTLSEKLLYCHLWSKLHTTRLKVVKKIVNRWQYTQLFLGFS